MAKKKETVSEDKLILVKASEHLLGSRYITLPPSLLTKAEYKQLKAGDSIAIEEAKYQFHQIYFVEVDE